MQKTYPEEAEDGRDSMIVMDPERLKIFVDYMESHSVGLVRSPPYSGKTTLGMRLQEHYLTHNYNAVYISLASLENNPYAHSYKGFNEYWESEVGSSWISISKRITPTRIIVDEAQVVYDSAGFFWGSLKILASTQYKHNIRVLLLSTYHPTYNIVTPMTFPDALGLLSLRLTEDEFGQLVSMYVQKRKRGRPFDIPKSVEKVIFNFTRGYVGICRTALTDLYQKFPNSGPPKDMLKHLASKTFLNRLLTSRALYWVHNWQPIDQEATFLRNLLLKCNPDSAFESIDRIGHPTIKIFLKIGIIIEDHSREKMYFIAPIMRIILSNQLFIASLPNLPTKTFDEFLLRTIERMSPSALKNSFGRGYDSYLLERTWQMEWYRTAKSAMPEDAIISPDVGHIFGSDGFLDFYVDGNYSWGIELTREGKRLRDHAKRFDQDGEYENIPMNEWVIIDFRHYSKRIRNSMPNFWYILYSDDYKQVTILRHNKEDRVLRLIGDDFR